MEREDTPDLKSGGVIAIWVQVSSVVMFIFQTCCINMNPTQIGWKRYRVMISFDSELRHSNLSPTRRVGSWVTLEFGHNGGGPVYSLIWWSAVLIRLRMLVQFQFYRKFGVPLLNIGNHIQPEGVYRLGIIKLS